MNSRFKLTIAVMASLFIAVSANEASAQNKQFRTEKTTVSKSKAGNVNAIDANGTQVSVRTENQQGSKRFEKASSAASSKATTRATATDGRGNVVLKREED